MGWRTLVVLWQSVARLDKGAGMLAIAFAGVGLGAWSDYFPWWMPYAAFGILLLIGFLRANYEELQEVAGTKKELEDKLAAYEDSGKPKVVAKVQRPGPVSINEGPPYVVNQENEGSSVYLASLVPYKTYATLVDAYNDPAAHLEVEDADDAYLVALSYEAQATTERSSQRKVMEIETRVRVLNEDGDMVRQLAIYTGSGELSEEGSWRHTVSGSSTLLGLPEGVYGLHVFDYVRMVGSRDNGLREYRNMRLRVTRQ